MFHAVDQKSVNVLLEKHSFHNFSSPVRSGHLLYFTINYNVCILTDSTNYMFKKNFSC